MEINEKADCGRTNRNILDKDADQGCEVTVLAVVTFEKLSKVKREELAREDGHRDVSTVTAQLGSSSRCTYLVDG